MRGASSTETTWRQWLTARMVSRWKSRLQRSFAGLTFGFPEVFDILGGSDLRRREKTPSQPYGRTAGLHRVCTFLRQPMGGIVSRTLPTAARSAQSIAAT